MLCRLTVLLAIILECLFIIALEMRIKIMMITMMMIVVMAAVVVVTGVDASSWEYDFSWGLYLFCQLFSDVFGQLAAPHIPKSDWQSEPKPIIVVEPEIEGPCGHSSVRYRKFLITLYRMSLFGLLMMLSRSLLWGSGPLCPHPPFTTCLEPPVWLAVAGTCLILICPTVITYASRCMAHAIVSNNLFLIGRHTSGCIAWCASLVFLDLSIRPVLTPALWKMSLNTHFWPFFSFFVPFCPAAARPRLRQYKTY